MRRLSDTSPEAERVLIEAIRRMPFERKWRQMGALYRTARVLHEAGVRARRWDASGMEIRDDWARLTLDRSLLPMMEGKPVTTNEENLGVLRAVLSVLDRLKIPYALGGSWASSLLGKPRLTHDADVTAEPFDGKENAFCASFDADYYISLVSVLDALRLQSSFNIIHLPTGFKVDVFVRKDRPFERSLMARRQPRPLPDDPAHPIHCVSAEDIILLKLEWFRIGGEQSERQWNDVLGVMQVQGDSLNAAYLDLWATQLGVSDLLARARQESAA